MGLLDDAIREHLELKRRHGADPDDVARQEREALGAPRRGEFAQPEGAAAVDVAPERPVEDAGEVPPAEPEMAEPTAEPEPADERNLAAEAPPEPVPGTEEDPWLVEELADEVPEEDTLEHPAAKPSPEEPGEDVLEETPEFLQETPEHDRLWFEQKPPRGFDWEK
jgi:hypothetical protein